MAHKIEKRDKQYGIEVAWHGLTDILEKLTKAACFPWQVLFAPVQYVRPDGEIVKFGNWVLPIADDDMLPLGFQNPINLDTYTPETPQDIWNHTEQVLNGTEYQIVSAGTVQNRSKFYISSKLLQLEAITIADGSKMELIFNSMGSLDKSLNKKMCVSGTRTVCYNTLMMNFLGKQDLSWKYRHGKNFVANVGKDTPKIEQAIGYSKIVKATFDKLVATPCDVDKARAVYTGFLRRRDDDTEAKEVKTRTANLVDEHVAAFRAGDGNNGRTEFDLLNGWTQPRTRGYSDSKKDKFSIFETSDFGSYAADKSEFAAMLTSKRDPMFAEIESKGRKLVAEMSN